MDWEALPAPEKEAPPPKESEQKTTAVVDRPCGRLEQTGSFQKQSWVLQSGASAGTWHYSRFVTRESDGAVALLPAAVGWTNVSCERHHRPETRTHTAWPRTFAVTGSREPHGGLRTVRPPPAAQASPGTAGVCRDAGLPGGEGAAPSLGSEVLFPGVPRLHLGSYQRDLRQGPRGPRGRVSAPPPSCLLSAPVPPAEDSRDPPSLQASRPSGA
ncbi:uncharacterized protein LOC120229483 [Hyaena hyaena]|uniref:uncharacterized protein LOC120229483 n=1 Tax=Hyaena hyaena TaxID=95912 RepID=UPI0019225578|nr:uncharacterized protein LOC120229483 [Hyaena hyaena]